MKSKSLLLLFLLFHCFLNAQTLKSVFVDLDPNGQVFDVKYITSMQKYIVVGKFSSIQGHLVNNMALLDENFNWVNATFPTVNNEIRCVETFLSNLYIGGLFTTVNGTTQYCLARLSITAPAVSTDPYVIAHVPAFQLLNTFSSAYYVADMDLTGNEIVAVGGFYDNSRNGILAFSASSGNLSTKFGGDYGIHEYYDQYTNYPIFSVDKLNNNYVVAGPAMRNYMYDNITYPDGTEMMLFNNSGVQLTGNTLPSYHTVSYSSTTFPTHQANEISVLNDSIVLTNLRHGSGAVLLGALNIVHPASYQVLHPVASTGYDLGNAAIISYNNSFFYIRNNKIERSAFSGTTGSGASTVYNIVPSTTINLGAATATPSLLGKMLHKVNNFLVVTSDNLSSVAGQLHTGLAIMCLEPEDAEPMNNLYNMSSLPPNPPPFDLDTIVCAGNMKAYTVPPAKYAKGYKWTYNGPGVKYIIATSATAVPTASDFLNNGLPLNGSIYSETPFSYKIWLQYDESFTGGQLKVEPYSTCNTATDYLFAKPATANLHLAPLPNLNIADSLILTCVNDTLNLVATSSTPGVSFSWINQYGNTVNGSTIQLTLSGMQSISLPRYFQATVSQTSGNMCKVRDSVHINRSVIKPEMILNGTLPIWNCNSDSLTIEVIDTNSLAPETPLVTAWNEASGDFSNTNPLTIYSDTASIIFIATYPSNGCVDTTELTLSTDLIPPTQQISGFPSGFQQVGTITCTNDSLLIVLSDYNSINTNNYWIYEGDTISDSVWVSATDPSYSTADTLGANLVTVILDEYRVNPANGCSTFGPLAAVVFDIRQPAIIDYTGPTSLTCSADELVLEHVPTFGIPNQGWQLPNGTSNGEDTLVVTGSGEFYYLVEGANGCLSIDTVQIQQTNELLFASAADTIVCPGTPFTVNATAIGSGTMTYSWSNGTQTISPNGIGGIDSVFIVQASNGLGCSGIDTLMARITAPINATFEAFSSCGSGGFIQVDSIYGGAAAELSDYLFAFNGGAYSSTYNFPVSQIASYPLLIKDTLGCEYSFTTEITGVIQNPGVNFLVSTYNQVGDTIALVNISDFSEFDGVFWTVPSGVDLIQAYDSVAIFTAADSGWYQIQFTGYLIDTAANPSDTCFYSFDKYVYFGNFAMNFGDSTVDNSISNVQLYPNPIQAGQSQSITLSFNIASLQQYKVIFTSSLGEVLTAISDEGSSQGDIVKSYNLPPLSAGTYLIHILAEYGAAQVKLIVQ